MVCSSSSAVWKDFASCFSYALSCLRKEDLVLKHEQSEALEFVFRGKDVFVWFPAGFGKSICYQALPYMFDHKLGISNVDCKSVVIVVSPLVSLMVDPLELSLQFFAAQDFPVEDDLLISCWLMRGISREESLVSCLVPLKQFLSQRDGVSCYWEIHCINKL